MRVVFSLFSLLFLCVFTCLRCSFVFFGRCYFLNELMFSHSCCYYLCALTSRFRKLFYTCVLVCVLCVCIGFGLGDTCCSRYVDMCVCDCVVLCCLVFVTIWIYLRVVSVFVFIGFVLGYICLCEVRL